MKYELKTKKNDADVDSYLDAVEDEKKKSDSFELLKKMKEISGEEPKMWGSSIIGFGSYSYKSKSGIEGEWFIIGFAPRKKNISIYLMQGFDQHKDLMEKLGKFTTGKGCLYINSLKDVDNKVLEELFRRAIKIDK
jgi:hypothetical protein